MNMGQKVELYGGIIDNLKVELSSLTLKIIKTRENHDFGTYKNLILAYKEVLNLYRDLVEDKKDGIEIVNINNTFKIDEDGNIDMITDKIYKKMSEQLKNKGITN